jgi:hypothetical protein
VNVDVILPLASSVVSFVFCLLLVDQWRVRRRPHQAIWAIGMLWYGISAGTEFLGGAFGWSEVLYRLWYLIGAVYVAAWLGLGTAFLLGRTRFGYSFALSLFLAGLFTYLTQSRQNYPDSGIAPVVYFAIAVVLAVVVVVLTYREQHTWPIVAGWALVIGSLAAALMVLTVRLPSPGYVLNGTGIPVGDLFPGYIRLLTPIFNITGGFTLVFGALFSAYVFMPKRRVVQYSLDRDQPAARFIAQLPRALVAIVVNFVASLPGAARSLVRGELNSRVPSTILVAIGGFIPSITSGLNRFGSTSVFFLGELLGVVFLFLGFLASIEVFREFRVPFTSRVLRARRAE